MGDVRGWSPLSVSVPPLTYNSITRSARLARIGATIDNTIATNQTVG